MASHSSLDPEDILMQNETEQDEGMAGLFGNEDDEDEARDQDQRTDRLDSQERDHRRALEYEEEEEPPDVQENAVEMPLAIANLPTPKSSNDEKWVLRLPKFVKLESMPFHADRYSSEQREKDDPPMVVKLRVENTIRWRWVQDELGNHVKQSNARVIRWSDGSLSLRLGKELFDINQSYDTSGGVQRQSGGKAQGLTYLASEHRAEGILQSEGAITGYMYLRPTDMASDVHRMLVKSVGEKHNKVARLKLAPDPVVDPVREVEEAVKKSKKREPRSRDSHGGGSRRRTRFPDKGMEDDDYGGYGDDSDEEEGRSRRGGSAKKARRDDDSKGDYQTDDFLVEDEEEDSDDDRRRHTKEDDLDRLDAAAEKAKRRGTAQGDDDAAMDVESEEEEDDEPKVRRAGGSRRKRAAYDEDEDED